MAVDYLGMHELIDAQTGMLHTLARAGCWARCYTFDVADDELEDFLKQVQNSLTEAARTALGEYLDTQAENAAGKHAALASMVSGYSRFTQGTSVLGDAAEKAMKAAAPEIGKQIAKESVRLAGKGGKKFLTRIGSKHFPYIAPASFVYQCLQAETCRTACQDGKYTSDERFTLVGK